MLKIVGVKLALLSGATGDSGFGIVEMGRGRTEVPEEKIHWDRVVQLLVDAGANIDAQGWFGDTALFSLNKDAVQKLIDNHISLEIRDDSGETALIETVSASIANLLIEAGANVNAQDNDGKTARRDASSATLRPQAPSPGESREH